LHVDQLAVRLAVFLHILQRLPRGDDSGVVSTVLLGQFRRKEIMVRLADKLRQRSPHCVAKPLVRKDNPPLQVLAKDVQGQAFDKRLIQDLGFPQRSLSPSALDGVAEGSLQHPAVQFALQEIVLRALLDGLDSQLLILQAAQHHDRRPRRLGARPEERLDPGAVGQAQVQENGIGLSPRQQPEPFRKPFCARQLDPHPFRLAKILADQAGVAGVVLDQQYS
jgi:hypothetical protein